MTIPTTSAVTIALGNGTVSVFSFSFIMGVPSNAVIYYTDTSGNQTQLSPSQYTLFINPPATNSIWGVGGTVTFSPLSPIPDGSSLSIGRAIPFTQTTTISNQGVFSPEVIEAALDTLCLQIQQVAARTGAFRGVWATGILYNFGDIVVDGANGTNTGNYYVCINANTSGVWSTDLSNGDWNLFINIVQIIAYVNAAAASAAAAAASAVSAANSAATATTQAGIATTEAGIATTQAGIATTQAGIATAAAMAASNYAVAYSGTSTTSLAVGAGSQTFTTQSGKLWVTGQILVAASNAVPTNFMVGQVTSYSGTTLILNVDEGTGGSGTYADWNISMSGAQGPSGAGTGFDAIGSGTNTTAAMVVGTGASLSASGSGSITSTSCSGNASTVTTNANLTGVITSVGNTTSINSQTGTGTKFVVDTSPTLVTPNIGAATGSKLNLNSASGSTNTGDVNITGSYKVNGTAIGTGLIASSAQASTSGTHIDFPGLPAGIKQIIIVLNGVSTSGTSPLLVQLSTSGTFVTSGYSSAQSTIGSVSVISAAATAGFNIAGVAAADLTSGNIMLSNITANTWVESGNLARPASVATSVSGGKLDVGGVLDGVRITTVSGTDTFDAGSINIFYQ